MVKNDEKDLYIQYLINLEEDMKPIISLNNQSNRSNGIVGQFIKKFVSSLLKWLKSGISNSLCKLLHNFFNFELKLEF